jgi:hypothetical protein
LLLHHHPKLFPQFYCKGSARLGLAVNEPHKTRLFLDALHEVDEVTLIGMGGIATY